MSADCEAILAVDAHVDSATRATLRLQGAIDLATTPVLRSAVHGQLAHGRNRLKLDLQRVDFAGVSALEAILNERDRCVEAGGWLYVCHVPSVFCRVLAVTGLFTMLSTPPRHPPARPVSLSVSPSLN